MALQFGKPIPIHSPTYPYFLRLFSALQRIGRFPASVALHIGAQWDLYAQPPEYQVHTQKQRDASCRNGAKSKGPNTAEGKFITRHNAVTHGLYGGAFCVLQTENDDAFQLTLRGFQKEFQPATAVEETLVEEMAFCVWRKARLIVVETTNIQSEVHTMRPDIDKRTPDLDEGQRVGLG